MNNRKIIINVNGVKHKITSVFLIQIFEHIRYKEFDYDEPVLYIQTRRKSRKRKSDIVKEIVFPLSEVKYMM